MYGRCLKTSGLLAVFRIRIPVFFSIRFRIRIQVKNPKFVKDMTQFSTNFCFSLVQVINYFLPCSPCIWICIICRFLQVMYRYLLLNFGWQRPFYSSIHWLDPDSETLAIGGCIGGCIDCPYSFIFKSQTWKFTLADGELRILTRGCQTVWSWNVVLNSWTDLKAETKLLKGTVKQQVWSKVVQSNFSPQ